MNERYYGLNEMNEMNYGLKEIKMKCDQWSRWCDRRKELRSSDCFIKYCNISYEKMVATAFSFYFDTKHSVMGSSHVCCYFLKNILQSLSKETAVLRNFSQSLLH